MVFMTRRIFEVQPFNFNKFIVILDCGHKILYDNTVDSIEEYKIGDELICLKCRSRSKFARPGIPDINDFYKRDEDSPF